MRVFSQNTLDRRLKNPYSLADEAVMDSTKWTVVSLLRTRCFFLNFVCGAAWILFCFPHTQAQYKPQEYAVKAAYLYNFSQFVEWPTNNQNSDSFLICVLGQDPFGPTLNNTLAGETVAGRNIVIKRISTPQDAVTCRVLFISSSEEKRLKQIFMTLGDASVLTVSDLPQFTLHGGMVQFLLQEDRVRFEVNLTTAEHARLTFSSELLKLAVNVRGTNQLGD